LATLFSALLIPEELRLLAAQAMAEKYIIRVTAGPEYDVDTHQVVPVNSAETLKVTSDRMDVELNVRVQNYRGLPRGAPSTSPYFSTPPHDYNKDQYSIAFRFTPKDPAVGSKTTGKREESGKPTGKEGERDDEDDEEVPKGISAMDLQWGNDFERPIRDRLPPGFNTALNIVKWWIDPGLEGDAYADQPHLYGPGLSSFNTLHVGQGQHVPEKGGLWFEEGGDEAGLEFRQDLGAPDVSRDRMRWALKNENKEAWVFEYGQTYAADFFNPYIDFGDFNLRLPGFTLPVMKYWDGQGLR
jgi:hypothetical protein